MLDACTIFFVEFSINSSGDINYLNSSCTINDNHFVSETIFFWQWSLFIIILLFFLIFTELSTKEVSLKRITNSTNPSCTVILYNPSWPSSGRWGRYISSSLTVNERYTSWIMYMDIYKHTFIVTKWHKVLYSISRLISIFRQVMDFTNIQRIMYEVRHCGDWNAWEGGLGGIKK